MIVHGDLDTIPMSQPEVFFAALVLHRQPAEFVRYWGEGHTMNIPANRREKYQRVFARFDKFGDITRDSNGHLLFEGETIRSRKGAPALTPADFSKFGRAMSPPESSASSLQRTTRSF